mgnify:CR=1 FL=1
MSRGELVKLRIREFAQREGWTLKEVADRSGVSYNTVKSYARSPGMAMADIGALLKLARTFDVSIEELLDFVEPEKNPATSQIQEWADKSIGKQKQ